MKFIVSTFLTILGLFFCLAGLINMFVVINIFDFNVQEVIILTIINIVFCLFPGYILTKFGILVLRNNHTKYLNKRDLVTIN